MQRTQKVSIFLGTGLFIIGTAIFAEQVGLTLGPGWGKSRIAILVLGILIALLPWIPWKHSKPRAGTSQSDLFTFPALLLVLAVYLWFISVSHGLTSNYYTLLATSFRQGQLSLSLRPDSALLDLANPYDPAARQGIKVPLDLSLYNGKFYLYWGPAPALLVAIVKPLFSGQISDAYLLFAFVSGTFLLEFLLLMHLQERFFHELPKWIVVLSIFIAGWINPTLWLLNRPKIYEAAIAGGQFFFLAGLFSAITALDRPTPSSWRLVLAGIFWSLAVGTRSVVVFPVVFMTLMVVIWFYRLYQRSPLKFAAGLIPLGVPLLAGAIAFCWYNWARFGSISETGFNYAMAGPYLQQHLNEMFLPAYAFQNFYNYLLHPFTVSRSFPFLLPIRGAIEDVLPWQVLPKFYSAQAITGILCSAPFVIFAIVPVIVLLKRLSQKKQADRPEEDLQVTSFHWIVTSLLGSFLLAFACLLVFFWAAMRYAQDFMPALTLLSLLGLWQGYRPFSQETKKRTVFAIFGAVLAGISILIGTLLSLAGYFTNNVL